MKKVVEAAASNIKLGNGPFAAAVVRNHSEIVALESNRVTKTCDPTAHAEVTAIRTACAKLGVFKLPEDCSVYTSTYPCTMCFGAIYWAGGKSVYYAATTQDAAEANFDDAFIYVEIAKPEGERAIPFQHLPTESAGMSSTLPFETWKAYDAKNAY